MGGYGTEILAGAAIVSALTGGYSAVSSDQAQKKSRNNQRDAQSVASANAARQNQLAEQSVAKVKKPDLAALLAGMQTGGAQQPSTLLTGPTGQSNSDLGR